jgi:hypothetical protein
VIIGFTFMAIAFAVVAVGVIGGIDAAMKPDSAWQQADQNKLLWVLGQLLGAFFCGIVGLVFAVIYFSSIRPQVIRAQGLGPPAAPQV